MQRKIYKQFTDGQFHQSDEYVALGFQFDGDTSDSNPTNAHLKYNNVLATATTFIYISDDDATGMDVTTIHSKLKSGDSFRVQALDDETKNDLFDVTGASIDAAGYYKIPVTHAESSGGDAFSGDDLGITIYQGESIIAAQTAQNPYVFDSATADADPTAGKLRFNNAADNLTTKIFIDVLNDDGLDITSKFEKIGIGSVIQIQEKMSPENSAIFDVNADLIDKTGYFEIPVTFKVSGSGADLADATDIIVFFHTSTEIFNDDLFRIRDDVDKTKLLAFNLSALAAVTTRTVDVPDYSGRMDVASATVTKTPAGSTETIDWRKGRSQVLDLQNASANITLTLIQPVAGTRYILKIIQGATPRTVILPSTVLIAGTLAPTTLAITTTDDAEDSLTLWFDGTNYITEFAQNHGANSPMEGTKVIFSDYIEGTTADPTTTAVTSGTAILLAEMTKTFTPATADNEIEAFFSGTFGSDSDATKDSTVHCAFFVDTVLQAKTQRSETTKDIADTDKLATLNLYWKGTHATSSMTIEVRFWITSTDSNPIAQGIDNRRSLTVKEVDE